MVGTMNRLRVGLICVALVGCASVSVVSEAPELESADIDRAELTALVSQGLPPIKACYAKALARTPGLQGKIAIRFTILETGDVADLTPTVNSVGSPEVAQCMVASMRDWHTSFRPPAPVEVECPFTFAPAR